LAARCAACGIAAQEISNKQPCLQQGGSCIPKSSKVIAMAKRKSRLPSPSSSADRPKVVVQFKREFKIPYDESAEAFVAKNAVGPWKQLADRFPGISLRPLFRTKPKNIQALVARARRSDPTYEPGHFLGYFEIVSTESIDLADLARTLRGWRSVQIAYVDIAGPDPVVDASDDVHAPNQGYLDPAPDGIDAEYAWGFAGGDGAGQRFIDLERGWTLDHEDLAAHGAALLHGTLRDESRSHGTSVLGEICAVDNALGCVGIVPNVAGVNVVSFHGSTRVDAIMAALENLTFGEVLLLEAQVTVDGADLLGPIEAFDAEFDAIRLATALGITVVEAGGNGTNNGFAPPLAMDTFVDPAGRQIFNPGSADFRDSGAIIVTAASAIAPHTRRAFAPHGQRIDCYAWGTGIETCASDDAGATDLYTAGFGGTSGASPIITGAALAVQGLAEVALGYRFSPLQMRAILSDPANGTAASAAEATAIGVMPNLRAIIDGDILNLTPDLYLRDFVGDTGEPHSGAISASPDIILLPSEVADPQASFGAGSGTENSSTLGFTAEAAHNNFIYVRVLNRGGADATNVEATVFWSPVATLVTPDLWTLVGSANLPNVPTGEILTVSPAIMWPAAQIPAPGHYCFVGLIGHPEDPAPSPGDLLDWDNFRRFIRENNNVTWRNFNVEDSDPAPDPTAPKNFFALPFLAPGAFDRARPFQLEICSRLPRGAKVYLEVPAAFARQLRLTAEQVELDQRRKAVRIPMPVPGCRRLPAVNFPAKSRSPMRLLVHIPKELRKHTFEISVKQLFEKQEVGRVTWRLAPKPQKPKPKKKG
jgi:hypothetical protein